MSKHTNASENEADELGGISREWFEEFEAAARRLLETRFRYSFIQTYKPVLDDAAHRSFDSIGGYRRWCEDDLPSWLGYSGDAR